MRIPRCVAGLLLATAVAACATATPPEPPPPVPARDARLLGDCGGFVPSAALLDAASALGDPARRAAAIAALDAAPAADRIDVLRAGLRLRDVPAARSCAARLEWTQIDWWECARCVELLVDDVLRPGTEADFEKFRSYLGSVEMPRLLRSLPPLPWVVPPEQAIGSLHRTAMGSHLPDYLELTRHPDEDVANAAWADISLLGRWNDEFRDEVARREVAVRGGTVAEPSASDAPGLPLALAAWLRSEYIDPGPEVVNDNTYLMWNEKIRWCWECTPGPRDAELLMGLAARGDVDWTRVAGVAYALLGKLHDARTEAFLRERATETDEHVAEQLAVWALARRGDAEMLERLLSDARDVSGFDDFALALAMEIAPTRARALLDELLLGPDDEAANDALDFLGGFAAPGAFFEPCGYDWRRTSFAGFDCAAVGAKIPAMRLARIGVVVPGCRTRELAVAAARALAPGDLVEHHEVAAFLETAAPAEFADALRRIRAAGGDDAPLASEWLVALGDAGAAEAAAAGPAPPFGSEYTDLARSSSPAIRKFIEDEVRRLIASGEKDRNGAVAALAHLHGLSEDAARSLWLDDAPYPRDAADAVLAGRPADAVAAVLAAFPDIEHGNVAACDDPRVRAYLARLRERRDLGHFWYATGQLAVLGEPAARAEFWGALEDGRYRIIDGSNFLERTLGWDLARTMPFWIEQLRSQCCRIVTGGGDIVDHTIGIDCFQSPWRTAHRRAKELSDAAGGRFVRSRIAGHWVPEPR